MSTRIHLKIPLPSPFRYLGEHLTHITPESKMRIRNDHGVVICCLTGEVHLRINQEEPVLIREGDVAIVPGPSVRVYSARSMDTLHYYTIAFQSPIPPAGASASAQHKELTALMKTVFEKNTILTGHGARLRQRLLMLRHELDDRETGSLTLIYSAVLNLCIEMIRIVIERRGDQDSTPRRRKGRLLVNSSLEYMLRNLRHPPSIENVAWELKVSVEHLCRSFRNELGTTPRAALRNLQMDEAKALLINSPWEIHKIATETGFTSTSTFCRYFHKAVGMTPTEYRTANYGNFKASKKNY